MWCVHESQYTSGSLQNKTCIGPDMNEQGHRPWLPGCQLELKPSCNLLHRRRPTHMQSQHICMCVTYCQYPSFAPGRQAQCKANDVRVEVATASRALHTGSEKRPSASGKLPIPRSLRAWGATCPGSVSEL